MNFLIIDICYTGNTLGVASQMIKNYCVSIGCGIALTEADADYVLISIVHPQLAYKFKKFTKPIIAGGPGALSPSSIGVYANFVVLGDFRKAIYTLHNFGEKAFCDLNNIWINKDSRQVSIDNSFPFEMQGYVSDNGTKQVFVSRGCKRKCAFCQTGWGTIYQECKVDIVIKNIGGKFNFVSNAISDVSYYDQLKKYPGAASHTFDSVSKNIPGDTCIRIGVEGVSERLRKAIMKPIKNEDLINTTVNLINMGKTVRWFMIAGLPFENECDWEEFKSIVAPIAYLRKAGNFQISFTAYVPEPATPISDLKYSNEYYSLYKDFADWFFACIRRGWIRILKCQFPENRNEKALWQMGIECKNDRVLYPYRNLIKKYQEHYIKSIGAHVVCAEPPAENQGAEPVHLTTAVLREGRSAHIAEVATS
jgi:hypothetical protein